MCKIILLLLACVAFKLACVIHVYGFSNTGRHIGIKGVLVCYIALLCLCNLLFYLSYRCSVTMLCTCTCTCIGFLISVISTLSTLSSGVWAHGDYCVLSSTTGGIVMLGRR